MSLFVPTTAGWQTAIADHSQPRYYKVQIDTDDNDVLDDVTSFVQNNFVGGVAKAGYIAEEWTVRLRNATGTFAEGDFAGAICAIQAQVGAEGYITIFTGWVSEEGCKRFKSSLTDDYVVVTMHDAVKRNGTRQKTERVTWADYKICDTANPSTSIFHQLAALMGLATGDLDVTTIDYTKDYVLLNGNTTAWSELQKLAAQYLGRPLAFRYDGKLRMVSRFDTGWSEPSPEWTFEEGVNIHEWDAENRPISGTRATTKFDDYEQVGDAGRVIYRNVEGWSAILEQCEIVVAAGDYWPGPNSGDLAQLKYTDPGSGEQFPLGTDIITPTIGTVGSGSDIECDGGLLTLTSFNGSTAATQQNPDNSEIILQNATGSPITMRNFEVRGTASRVIKAIQVQDIDTTVADEDQRDVTIDGTYAVDEDQAHITTEWTIDWLGVVRKVYNIVADWLPNIQKGAAVTLSLPSVSVNMTCIVESFAHPEPKGPMGKATTTIVLIEKESFSSTRTPVIITEESGDGATESAEILEAERQIAPPDEDLLGHWPFDEEDGLVAVDVSGRSENATLTTPGSGAWEPGQVGGAYHYDSSLFTIPDNDSIDLGTGDFSLSAIIYHDDSGAGDEYIYRHSTGGNDGHGLLISSADNLAWYAGTTKVVEAAITNAGWHTVEVTRIGTAVKLYIDAVLVDSGTSSANLTIAADATVGESFDGLIDELRLYDKGHSQREVNFQYLNSGGMARGLITADRMGYASITDKALIFGANRAFVENDQILTEAMGELFKLSFSCLSNLGRIANPKQMHKEPAILRDGQGNEFDNPRAKDWTGLLNTDRTDTIGVFQATENVVADPEDLTTANWVTGSGPATATLTDMYFDGKRFSKVNNDGAAAGWVYQVIDTSGFSVTTPCVQFIAQQGSGPGDESLVIFRDVTAGLPRVSVSIDWAGQSVTAATGTLVDAEFISATICHVSVIATTITPANTHRIRCYASADAVANEYNYYTAVQVEDKIYPTPYTPTSRAAGVLKYSKTLAANGAVSCWVRGRSTYDDNADHVIWSWYKDATHYFRLLYDGTGETYRVEYRWGGTEREMVGPAVASNAAYWTWTYIKVAWDFPTPIGILVIDGTKEVASWSGAVDAYDLTGLTLYLGENGDGTLHFDGEITDLAIEIADNESTAHYLTDRPWKDEFTASNFDQSVSFSRKVLEIVRAELTMVDKANRTIDLGSQGIQARDRAGQIIHDIPDAPIQIGNKYCGHVIWFHDDSGLYEVVNVTPTLATWQTGNDCVVDENTNVKAGIFRIYLSGDGAAAAISAQIFLRPTGTTWGVTTTSVTPVDSFELTGLTADSVSRDVVLMCPISEGNQIDYWVNMTPNSVTKILRIYQIGIII